MIVIRNSFLPKELQIESECNLNNKSAIKPEGKINGCPLIFTFPRVHSITPCIIITYKAINSDTISIFHIPVARHRECLSWTRQRQRLFTLHSICRIGTRIFCHWKFRFCTGNRFYKKGTILVNIQ